MYAHREESTENIRTETSLGRCLVDGDATAGSPARRKAFGLSFTIEAAALVLLLVSPLLGSATLPQLHTLPPMPIALGNWHHRPANSPTPSKPSANIHRSFDPFSRIEFPAPNTEVREDSPPDDGPLLDSTGPEISGAIQGLDFSRMGPIVEPPHIEPAPRPEKQILKVSEGVQQAQMISRMEPRYPALAVQTHTQGTVYLHAVISREGRITLLQVISGHPLLVPAALAAVQQWRYRPTLLNGEAVEVETTITVIFRLNN